MIDEISRLIGQLGEGMRVRRPTATMRDLIPSTLRLLCIGYKKVLYIYIFVLGGYVDF